MRVERAAISSASSFFFFIYSFRFSFPLATLGPRLCNQTTRHRAPSNGCGTEQNRQWSATAAARGTSPRGLGCVSKPRPTDSSPDRPRSVHIACMPATCCCYLHICLFFSRFAFFVFSRDSRLETKLFVRMNAAPNIIHSCLFRLFLPHLHGQLSHSFRNT